MPQSRQRKGKAIQNLESKPASSGDVADDAQALPAIQSIGKIPELLDWLGARLKADLPGKRAFAALCPADTRDWQVHVLPRGEVMKWPADHPLLQEIRDYTQSEPCKLGETAAPGMDGGQSLWMLPCRDTSGALLGALILEDEDGPRLMEESLTWLLSQGGVMALLIDRIVKARRLAQVEKDLSELESLKSGFMDTVSHELKTPLTSIIGFASLAVTLPGIQDIPPLPEFLTSINDSAQKLDILISEMLVMSNFTSAESTVDIRSRDFAGLVCEFRDGWLPKLEQHERVRLSTAYPVDELFVDGHKFFRILEHLIRNALKFSPVEQAVEVEWSYLVGRRRGDNSDFLRVDIHDHGAGIPEGELGRIFQKFYQVDNSSTREHGGAGLGLASAREFTKAMGGKLWVRSELGGGSTFSFTVPASRNGEAERI